ncbi:MAG: ABC transporter, permease protein 1 (cluster 5, nickel/peptides/opines), partial [uncultured Acetobacteraceae bacterium]
DPVPPSPPRGRAACRDYRADAQLHAHAAVGRPGHLHCGTQCVAGGCRAHPSRLRPRSTADPAVFRLDRPRRVGRLRYLLFLPGAGGRPDRATPAHHDNPGPRWPRNSAGGRHPPRDRRRGAGGHLGGPDGDAGRAGGTGHAVLLARAVADDRARAAVAVAADLRDGILGALRDARNRAGLLGHPGADAVDTERDGRGAVLRLHPHRTSQGADALVHPGQARVAQRSHPRRLHRGGAAWFHARRLDRDRDGVRAPRRGLPGLGKHQQERLPGGAGRGAGAGADLHRPDPAGRPVERGPRPQAAHRM